MADSEAGTSRDAARASAGEYQVFLSFRGPDTRNGFTDFLYRDLENVGFRVFRDDEELRVGDVIGESLLCAINSSIIYIPIFSVTYADSKWCLRELANIVENVSKSEGQKRVLPIFFHIEPEDVKLKTPLYSDALSRHAMKFPDEVQAWRAALEEVGKIKGWNVKEDQSQAKIVNSVVRELLEKMDIKQKILPRHLVRHHAQVKRLIESLDINQSDVRLIAIYGMGGIGKTTVAQVVFNQLSSSHFGSHCSFLEDVRESSSTKEGIVRLQKKLLSDIVGSRFAEQVKDWEQGMKRIGEALSNKAVLVVLDDVADEPHIESLIGNCSLPSGSRIIITTRDKTIPSDEGFNGEIQRYEMPEMDAPLALQLFCRHAFGKNFPRDDYCSLSNEIVSSIGGLPLAVEVIGSSLKRRDKAVWEETLVNLKKVPKEKILKRLKISYDGLDKNQKQIFLDIACFFFNEKKTNPIYMWASCQFNPLGEIEVLIERCLIKILDNDKFWMHDQLIALGREIVHEDSLDEFGKQSRLWIAEEAIEIIRTEERKDKVQAVDIDGLDDSIEITNQEFERLQKLRFLKLRNGTFVGDFAKCCSKLRWISWRCPRQDFRPDNMYLDHLVVFELGANGFTDDSKAWNLIERAKNLKVISLTECAGITTIPDFSKCLRLERLTLARCSSLERIESFIGDLQSLIELKIEDCRNFMDLPKEVGKLVKLEHFSLSGCEKLIELPGSIGNLISLTELDLSGTHAAKLSNSIGKLKSAYL
ncbi:disease resistance protein L6-like isoform X2 [Rhodamnia argentea]|uniref:Disease resistance protein L6-like isoform X2 n=1 Tax=Rhodamnia argentea TaxID=178133 RepID=A0ABM3HAJ1_9MYRT|nr:disease resistance protein L6-like isoform X2 [Rhodamnia argentea]